MVVAFPADNPFLQSYCFFSNLWASSNPFMLESESMITCTSSLSCTLSSIMPSKMPWSVEITNLRMLTLSWREMMAVTSLRSPIWSMPLSLMVASNSMVRCMSHFTSIILLPKLDFSLTPTSQSRWCTSMWFLLSMNPMASSPGMGQQHLGTSECGCCSRLCRTASSG